MLPGGLAAQPASPAHTAGMIAPWRWARVPVSPFEATLRLADAGSDAALDPARAICDVT